eukprot:scaffold9542_cov92-Cylindrotheca_fusiformis.AAC.1
MQHHRKAEDVWIYTGQDKVPKTVRRVKRLLKALQGSQLRHSKSIRDLRKLSFPLLFDKSGSLPFMVARSWSPFFIKRLVKRKKKWAFHRMSELLMILAAFSECESLTEVDVPSTVKVIDDSAFSCCQLSRLNKGLERIGAGSSFAIGVSLTEVNLPSTVKVIDDSTFQECTNLERLGLNGGLERIGSFTFGGCGSLTEVEISSTAKVIGDRAFYGCKLFDSF